MTRDPKSWPAVPDPSKAPLLHIAALLFVCTGLLTGVVVTVGGILVMLAGVL